MPSSTILVGYDPRRPDLAPVELGIVFARLAAARLIVAVTDRESAPVVAVSADQQIPYAIVDRDLVEDAAHELEQVRDDLEGRGVKADFVRLRSTSAARALQAAAEAEHAALIVVGSSRAADKGRVRAGSTAVRLLSGAPCPVAVAPSGWTAVEALRTIGVGYVDTDEGRAALQGALAVARRAGAVLRVITALKEAADAAEHRSGLEQSVRDLVGGANGGAPLEFVVTAGDAVEVLVGASVDLDVLVCGSRGYGPLRAVLLGSVSRRVATSAHCPVVVVPRGIERPLDELFGAATAAAHA